MNNIEEIIKGIRKRIYDFRSEENYNLSAFVFDINAIEIATSLSELGLKNNRKIKNEERVWFEGERYLQDTLGNSRKWVDLFDLYCNLVEEIKQKSIL